MAISALNTAITSKGTETEAEFPQRVCVGLNMNRIKMLTGILRKHTKTKIFHDTFFNIVGGLKIDESETCIDLALVTALLSSLNEFVVPRTTCIMGELSLNGPNIVKHRGFFFNIVYLLILRIHH